MRLGREAVGVVFAERAVLLTAGWETRRRRCGLGWKGGIDRVESKIGWPDDRMLLPCILDAATYRF